MVNCSKKLENFFIALDSLSSRLVRLESEEDEIYQSLKKL